MQRRGSALKVMIGWVVLIDGEVGRGVSVLVKVYVAFDRCIRVCSDANATAGVVLGLGVDGISKHPNTVIT